MNNEILKIENVNVVYDKKNILNDINLSFQKNTINCIIGSSGCGKTTLLKVINKSIEFDKELELTGKIIFDNINTDDIDDTMLRKQIAMLMQVPIVFPFSIYKNLEYVLNYHFKLTKEEKEERSSIRLR